MKKIIIFVAILLVLCGNAFGAGQQSGNGGSRPLTPQQRQIQQHSVAANKRKTWEANRTNRQLYLKEKVRSGHLDAINLIPKHMRRPSSGWYYSLFNVEKPDSGSIDGIMLRFLETQTKNIDLTKPLPSGIDINFDSIMPIEDIDYLQVETMPIGGIWTLSDVWYKAEDPEAIEVINLNEDEKGVLFKKAGAIRLRAFAVEKGKVYSWKAFINVEPGDTPELSNSLMATENNTNTPVSWGTFVSRVNAASPAEHIDYVKKSTMPLGSVWEISSVWYEPEDRSMVKLIDLEGGKKGLKFVKVGDVMLKAIFRERGKTTIWNELVRVIPEQDIPKDMNNPAYVVERVVELVNQERAKYKLPPLRMSEDLQIAAAQRAMELETNFSHTRPNGSSCFTVLKNTGRTCGENIACGQINPDMVVDNWMHSKEGHRENILDPKYREIGVGYHGNGRTQMKHFWVQIFRG
jgi:hypothetical protein